MDYLSELYITQAEVLEKMKNVVDARGNPTQQEREPQTA